MKRTATVSESESAMFLNTAMSQQTLNTSAGHCRLYSFKSSWNPLSHYKRVNQAEGPWPLTTLHSFMCPTKKLDTHTATDYSTNYSAKSLEKSCKKLELGNSLKPSLCSPACIYKMHFYSHAFQVLSQASGTVLCYNKELLLILQWLGSLILRKKPTKTTHHLTYWVHWYPRTSGFGWCFFMCLLSPDALWKDFPQMEQRYLDSPSKTKAKQNTLPSHASISLECFVRQVFNSYITYLK